MKAFLWHEINKVSDNYHEYGSVLIEAESLERARAIGENECSGMTINNDPSAVFDSSSNEEKVWVFPNAGCC